MSAPLPTPPGPIRFALGWLALGLLALVCWHWGPDGHEHARLAQFIGRFHPVIVHLPIALILLVPILELAGRASHRAHLRAAAGFVLGLTAIAAILVAFDGWLLARSGGYRGHLVVNHMWAGVIFAGLCLAAAALRGTGAEKSGGAAYGIALVACLGAVVWTSHQGGSLSHGEGYLTELMPARLQSWLRVKPAPILVPFSPAGPANTVYTQKVQPIFQQSCISCHGPLKTKGGLRMDTYAELMLGGEDGPVVAPWLPQQSDLVRRITLTPDDDDFMPSNDKHILTPAQVKLIELWIAAGASDREPVAALASPVK